ncbi:MAG: ImuA family protein [Sphingomonas sp.]|uniref:ImuA family protein n=1 Tax=Sphingomonas sp. TaxID=28214 RepID=UPI003F8198A7
MPESPASLARLRRRVARIEGVRARDSEARFATGHEAIDAWLGGGLARGRLHEMMADEGEDAGSLAGFAAMLAVRIEDDKPLLWLRTEAAEREAGKLYATGLGELGLRGSDLILGLLVDDATLLKAANDAARCAGLGALVVETWGEPKPLDLTATRRLMLAAEASGVTVLLLRAAARESPSVADTRWRVAPAPSTALADGTSQGAPGYPVFDIELLRRRAGPAGRQWRVEWNRERRSFQPLERPALPGAVLPVAAG